ncbi:MAG TPA: DUF4037 domain-containing protein [Anaeromyxobacteraceae bacterium]|nr:DUF4037 domain-containing protein [Anaeromyxobacteraceae bacterium]
MAARYAALPAVEAVALGGSLGAEAGDERSDLDFYVYAREPLTLEARAAVARASAPPGSGARLEIGNEAFEPGDEWIDAEGGLHLDVMFRTPAWIEAELDRVLSRCQARVGYSTCFWWNVLRSEPLFDRAGWLAGLRRRAEVPYPEALRRAVLARNHPLLRGTLSSFLAQIERAVARRDAPSVNHRVAALLASAFDVLFALNRAPHPGEKRLLFWAEALCPLRPPRLAERVTALLSACAPPSSGAVASASALLDDLDALLEAEGFLPPGRP